MVGAEFETATIDEAVVDLQAKMRLVCSGSRHDLRQHYLPAMWPMLISPMVKKGGDGVEEVIDLMDDYYLGVEDREAIWSWGWSRIMPSGVEGIPSAVKAGLRGSITGRIIRLRLIRRRI